MDRICITQKYQGFWKFQRKVPVISPCRGSPWRVCNDKLLIISDEKNSCKLTDQAFI